MLLIHRIKFFANLLIKQGIPQDRGQSLTYFQILGTGRCPFESLDKITTIFYMSIYHLNNQIVVVFHLGQ